MFHKSKKIGLAALNLQPHGNISLERSVIFLLGELTREQTNEQAGKLKKEKRKEKKKLAAKAYRANFGRQHSD